MREDDSEGGLSFGALVQRRRSALGLSRAALAQRVGCSPVTIKKIERDERRPSQQIAELLADHLLIPATERSRFVRMARGEVAPPALAAHMVQELPLPAFLRAPLTPPTGEDFPFVAREAELARLQAHLDHALHGSGQVVFITGEAGCGKSALAQEFARRSQQAYTDLVVAIGHCNAHTGAGDPYLPFREVLGLLTGDIELQAAASNLHPDHAHRLWQIMPATIRTLVEIGHDLFDTFIPTRQLLNRLADYIYQGASGLSPLHQSVATLVERGESAGKGNAQQSALFEQYGRVMLAVARQAPLLLILEDLQWADVGSINLLFHLGRHRAGRRILIVGIYRPADVALGRDGGRHPLEPVVNELQRHFGNSPIELGQSEGRAFVEALLDAQPNRYGKAFRDALFLQTGGHALFTVEMLRGLQEQGGVVQDDQGRWVEGPRLDWGSLPARVEGIIKERLGRLPPLLQESLKIASVEGEVFTAEVVAGVQGINTRTLIGQLSNVLDRQQDLIRILGVRRLDDEGRTRCQYRFRHILFQRFLYESIDEAERVYLHQAVGQEMEQLYAGHADEVALQLARHFLSAGDEQRALGYLVTAGDAAAAAYANTEAAAHYRRGLDIARRVTVAGATIIYLYTRLGRTLELNSQFNEALAIYEELKQLAHVRSDRAMALSALLAQSTLYSTLTPLHDAARGQALLEEALLLAREIGDQAAQAKILGTLQDLHLYAGRAPEGIAYGEQSLALARSLNLREQMAFTLNNLGMCYFSVGAAARAKAALQEARALWRELGNMPMLADSLSGACTVHLLSGEYTQAIASSQEAYELSRAAGNLWGQAYSCSWVGLAHWQVGAPDAAIGVMEESIRLAGLSGFAVPLAYTRADLALVLGHLGAVARGVALAQEAVAAAERQVPLFHFYALTRLAQLLLWQGDVAAAQACIASAERADLAKPPIFFYETLVTKAELALRQEDFSRARSILDGVLPDLRSFEVGLYLPRALYLRAQALLGLEQSEAAQAALNEARDAAVATNSHADLWPILMSLSRVETDATVAERLRRQAQEIVENIAAHAPTPELRTSFLNLPDVRTVFRTPSP